MGNYQTKRTKIYHQFKDMAKERSEITINERQKLIDFASLEHGVSLKLAGEVMDLMVRNGLFIIKKEVVQNEKI